MAQATAANSEKPIHSLVNSKFPVLLPYLEELHAPEADFVRYIKRLHTTPNVVQNAQLKRKGEKTDFDWSTVARPRPKLSTDRLEDAEGGKGPKSAFMKAIKAHKEARANTMRTANMDPAYRSSNLPLVDVFFELERAVTGPRLKVLLDAAWKADPGATLKLIFNARSIHLGKSDRHSTYKALGWLYENHPVTLLTNLKWLVRPVIEKKPEQKSNQTGLPSEGDNVDTADDDDDDADEITLIGLTKEDEEPGAGKTLKLPDETNTDAYNVQHGVSHGYWKDLLNILALAANDQLRHDGDPQSILNVKQGCKKRQRDWDHEAAKRRKDQQLRDNHARVVSKLENDQIYRALHLTVARLFASQLRTDAARLASGRKAQLKLVSLAGKWAPSPKEFHDKHTFVVSSIAEMLHDHDSVCPDVPKSDRELYLKHAREGFRRLTLSPLRRFLDVVERKITAEAFGEIKYERVPSLAMNRYRKLFIDKGFDEFSAYIDRVASGKSQISGATLLPSLLIKQARDPLLNLQNVKGAVQEKVLDGQWKTLVQRIRDSGVIQSSIAVCDVSGSMQLPSFSDGTCPMDSAIGLSLLLAEVTKPPFGGAFITFSRDPDVVQVGGPEDSRSLVAKVREMETAEWGQNTDFVAVFDGLILPMAQKHKLKQEDMVKQVFVFSDMHFDAAQDNQGGGRTGWASSYERIKRSFEEAGYEMPQLIFWNLAGGRETFYGGAEAPKPVTAADEGTALVSGYSQAQMKVFLDGGAFGVDEQEQKVEMAEVEGGFVGLSVEQKDKPKMDPDLVMRKAIAHPAYAMLTVVD